MLSIAHIRLRLTDVASNRDRAYELEIDRDLFGEYSVSVRYGRQGSSLRTVRYTATDIAQAGRIAASILRRRITARRRLGSAYILKDADGDCAELVRTWHRLGGADSRCGTVRPLATRPSKRPLLPADLPLFAA